MKVIKPLINETSYNMSNNAESGVMLLDPNKTLESCTLWIQYDGAAGGTDGTIELRISGLGEEEADFSNGYAVARTFTMSGASNSTDIDGTKILYDFASCKAVYTANTTTGTGSIRVYIVIEYID